MPAMPLPRIAILGSLNIDLVSYVPHHPTPGETLTSSSYTVSSGGKGANQAVACAKLSRSFDLSRPSASISMLGAVGDDSYGEQLLQSLKGYDVEIGGVKVIEGMNTGVATIIVDEPTGQNRIVFSPQANHSLKPEHFITLPKPNPHLLIMQLEIPVDTVLQALASARANSVPVLLNPAPAQELALSAYEGLAHLVMNETEAAILSDAKEEDLNDVVELQRVGGIFIERGCQNVVITLGGRGTYYTNKSGQSALIPPQKAEVVDTTAAGDTWIGSYALAVVTTGNGVFDIEAAVRKANCAAAKTVAKRGAQVSIPWRNEI